MLTTYTQSKFLSKVFTDCSGRQFRLTFLVAVVNGEVRGRLVSAEPISVSDTNHQIVGTVSDGMFCLPITFSNKKPATDYAPAFIPVVSPYTELYFFTSQPTRAPSIR